MNINQFEAQDYLGDTVSLSDYKGKVLLVVNTATKCGLTPQYTALEELYEKYSSKGLEILDFPCNQFQEQAPESNEEINSFCTMNFNTKFPRFAKIDVNGPNTNPIYEFLKTQKVELITNDESAGFTEIVKPLNPYFEENDIKWNFEKFLVDAEGNVVKRFFPNVSPEEIVPYIEELLK